MIPTLEEWLENQKYGEYTFLPPMLLDGGTQIAIAIVTSNGPRQAMRLPSDVFGGDRTAQVRHMKQTLVEWAKARGYNP